ncbi:MAG TPA: alpha/beta hydrolase fold domain-containing protein [Sphingobacteriaceae bacterium]|nr:alpha/beta hydrolase fold domain-containing protein [Sphingobacteriaceae bacterium]
MKRAAYFIFSLLITTGLFSCSKNDSVLPDSELKARTLTNISYGADPLQKIDVYLPAKRTYNTRVIFVIHGGGFFAGDKSDFSAHSQALSNAGFAVINVNYRLVDAKGANTTPPERRESAIKVSHQLADIRSIIDFADKQATSWIMSSSKWAITGHSAGATLSLLYAYGSLNSDNRIKAAGNWAGVTDLSYPDESYAQTVSPFVLEMLQRGVGVPVKNENIAAYQAVSPYWVLKGNAGKPTINIRPESNAIAGTPDFSKFQYAELTELLDSKNVPNKLFEVSGADHSFTKPGHWELVLNETAAFFTAQLK